MLVQKKLAAVGLAAGLVGGGAAGLIMGNSTLSGASGTSVTQDDTTTTEDPAATQPDAGAESDEATEDADRKAARSERLAEVLAPLVEDGTLNQAQADAVIAAIGEAMPEGGHRGGGPGGFRSLDAAAEAIGIDESELFAALRDGSTIAEVAEAAGVDPQTVIDAMVADAQQRLADKVTEGDITQEEADAKLADLTERVTSMVNEGMPEGFGGGHGPRGGWGPPGDASEQDDAQSDTDSGD